MATQDISKPQRQLIILWTVLVSIGIAWGATGPLSKLAVSTGNHPIGITAWGAIIGGSVLTLFMIATGRKLPLSKTHIAFYIVCGLLGTALPSSVSYTAYKILPIGVNNIVLSLVPMLTILMSFPLGLDTMNVRRFFGLGLGLLAVMLIAAPETSLPDPSVAIWVILPVIVAISYAAENVVIAKYLPTDCDAFTAICGLTWASLFWLVPALFTFDAWLDISQFGPPEWAIIGIAILHMIAYTGFVFLIDRAGPVFAAQVAYIVTGSAVLFGMIFYGETHSYWVWAALALMMIGLTLVRPRDDQSG